MADTTVSVRIDEQLYAKMKQLDTINWSAVMRKAVQQQIERTKQEDTARREKMRRASESIDAIRTSGVFNNGKSSVDIIRGWRNKRKF